MRYKILLIWPLSIIVMWQSPVSFTNARQYKIHGQLVRWCKWSVFDVDEATEGLENELWCRWSDTRVNSSFSNPSIPSPMSQLILQTFCCFTYITSWAAHGKVCMYIWGFKACQHLRSLAPVMNDNDGQMIFGDLGTQKFHICLTGGEKTRKYLTQETCPDRGSNRARCVTGAHATTCSTSVDL